MLILSLKILNYVGIFLFLYLMGLFRNNEPQLIYSVVLISALQQSSSIAHTYMLFFILLSIMVYHRRLNIVPCSVQWDLVIYPFYLYQIAPGNSKSALSHSLPSPSNHKAVFYVCESFFALQISFIFQVPHISDIICIYLSLSDLFIMIIISCTCVPAGGIISFSHCIYVPHLHPFIC